jgi:hypothetical protein
MSGRRAAVLKKTQHVSEEDETNLKSEGSDSSGEEEVKPTPSSKKTKGTGAEATLSPKKNFASGTTKKETKKEVSAPEPEAKTNPQRGATKTPPGGTTKKSLKKVSTEAEADKKSTDTPKKTLKKKVEQAEEVISNPKPGKKAVKVLSDDEGETLHEETLGATKVLAGATKTPAGATKVLALSEADSTVTQDDDDEGEDDDDDEEEDPFHASMTGLFKHLKSILKAHDSTRLKIGNLGKSKLGKTMGNPTLASLNRYIKIYETNPDLHRDYVADLYRKYRRDILKGWSNDGWLTDNTVSLTLGDDILGKGKKKLDTSRKYSVKLSSIYNNAVEMKKEAEERLNGLPDEEREKHEELNYPEGVLLYLYRLFHECAPKSDSEKIGNIIRELEDELGLEPEGNVESSGGIGGIMDIANQVLGGNMKGFKLPNQKEVKTIFNKIFSNPQTQSALGNITNNLKDCKDLGQALTKLTTTIDLKDMIQNVAETLSPETIEQARNLVESGPGVEASMKSTGESSKSEKVVEKKMAEKKETLLIDLPDDMPLPSSSPSLSPSTSTKKGKDVGESDVCSNEVCLL